MNKADMVEVGLFVAGLVGGAWFVVASVIAVAKAVL